MAKQERLQATIPAGNDWTNEDIEARAAALGMDKGEFILKAVDMLYNFDDLFMTTIKKYSEGLKMPEYMVIQNMILKRIAEEDAAIEVHGLVPSKVLKEFITVTDHKGTRMVTGEELYKILKDMDIRELKYKMDQEDK